MDEDEEPLMRCSLVVGNLLFGVGDLLVSSLGHLGFTVINGEFMLMLIIVSSCYMLLLGVL